jgi:CO/xanthine dehydrogenase FAD-binding subunit
MARISAYHRPSTIDEAVALLATHDRVPLGGGTVVVPGRAAVEVVDLQALGLDAVTTDGDRLRLGATATLQAVVDSPATPALLADLARRETTSLLRNQATVGGTVAAPSPDSLLLAGLLVHEAEVERHGAASAALAAALADGPGGLVTAVTAALGGTGHVAVTGRTPGDDPIVGAVGRRTPDGRLLLALTGVAATPVLVDPDDPTAALDPPGDFRGDADYRRHLAGVLAARVVEGLV